MEINNLSDFLRAMISLLKTIDRSSPVLFRRTFRQNYSDALPGVETRLRQFIEHRFITAPELATQMTDAGLTGIQLQIKLESFQFSLNKFEEEGGIDNLDDVLGKGGTLLSSLAGAIPGFGSFAQELVEFLLKELKGRFKVWPF